MTYFPDMGRNSMVAEGEHIRAIGWLHPEHPFPTGEVPARFLTRLKEFVHQSGASADALNFGAFGGIHTCEFCGRSIGSNNFGVPNGNLLFVAPEMIVHYVEVHCYRPPAEFVSAVLKSPLPEMEEYQLITEPFWHKHREVIEQMVRECEEAYNGGKKEEP